MANNFKNQGYAALTTGGNIVYTAPTVPIVLDTAIIHSMIISNIDGTNSANVVYQGAI